MIIDFTYEEILLMPEWQNKRIEIIHKRDKLICQKCHNHSYENENFYGPYFNLPEKNPPFLSFKSFSGKEHQVYVKDENGTLLLSERLRIMLYLSKHKENGLGEISNEGYFVAAARYLSYEELIHYFPADNPNFSDDEKLKILMKEFDILGVTTKPKTIIERKDLVDKPFNQLKWIFVKDLHVHHTYYQIDKMPWDYPDSSFVTLCRSCHTEVHEKEVIPVLDKNGVKLGNYKPCKRCNGAGWFPEYRHVQNGICFSCRGQKYLDYSFIKR